MKMQSDVRKVISKVYYAFVLAVVITIWPLAAVNAYTGEKPASLNNIVNHRSTVMDMQKKAQITAPEQYSSRSLQDDFQTMQASDAGSNIINNGDFESDPNYYGSWIAIDNSDVSASFIWDNETYHGSSGYSASIQGNGVNSAFINNIPINPGKVYSFSAWAKTLDVSSQNGFGICVFIGQYDENGFLIPGTDNYFIQDGTTDWQEANLNFISNPNADSAFVMLMLGGSGTVWFDDISLVDERSIPGPESKVVADPGIDRSTYKGFEVVLDGSNSLTTQGTSLTYNWSIVSAPEGSQSVISYVYGNPSFIADVAGEYTVALTVDNGLGSADTKQVKITAKEFNDTSDNINYTIMDSLNQNYFNRYRYQDFVPMADGWVIIGEILEKKIIIVNTLTGEIGKSYQLQAAPAKLDFDFDKGIVVATQADSNTIAKIDLNTDIISYINTTGFNSVLALGKGDILFTYSSQWPNGLISIIDIHNNSVVGSTTINQSHIGFMVFDRTGNNLVLGVKGSIPSSLYRYVYNESTNSLSSAQDVWDFGGNGQDLAISKDGRHVAFCCGGGNGNDYTIYDVDSSDITNIFGEWNTNAYPTSAVFSHDNRYVVTTNSSDIQLFDLNAHTLVRTLGQITYRDLYLVRISRGDKIVYGRSGYNLYFYKTDGSTFGTVPLSIDSITTDISSPQTAGTQINLTANTSGRAGDIYYHFLVYDGINWITEESFSTDNTFEWTPHAGGIYYLVIEAKGKNSANSYDTYNVIPFVIDGEAEEHEPASIEITGPGNVYIPASGETSLRYQYTAVVKDQYGIIMAGRDVTWSLGSQSTDVSISDTGVINITSSAQPGPIDVEASIGPISDTYTIILNQVFNSTITPVEAIFDKNPSLQADISITAVLNGNILTAIKNGANALSGGIDYTVSGSSITISKTYLAGLPKGQTRLTFKFSNGNDAGLTVEVIDTTVGDEVVSFPDPGLEEVIREIIGKTNGGNILISDVKGITTLYSDDDGIRSIAGIEKLSNLTNLTLKNGQISDLSPLAGLTSLKVIDIYNNKVSNIEPLGNMANLHKLRLGGNNISNIGIVKSLTQLNELLLLPNPVKDFSPAKNIYSQLLNKDFNLNTVSSIEISGPDKVTIPATGSITKSYTAVVKDPNSVVLTCEPVIWSLNTPVQGIQINSTTGNVTIGSSAIGGTFIVKAVNGSVAKTYTVTLSSDSSDSPPTGGGGGGGGGGSPNEKPVNGVINISPTYSPGVVTVDISWDNYKGILNSAIEENGVKNITINILDAGVDGYYTKLPTSALTSALPDVNISVNTAIANIMLPSNMFDKAVVQKAQNIGFTVSSVDKSGLPASVAKLIGDSPVIDLSVTINGTVQEWNNPVSPVTVSIPYTLKEGESRDNIAVFYIDSKGNLVNMQGVYDPSTKLVAFKTTHFSKYLVMDNVVPFTDLAGYENYRKYIESMAAKGIIAGIGNNQYAPGKVLTRAEYSKLLVVMLQLDISKTGNIFSDIKATDWYAPYVNAAYNAGLIKGIGSNKFAPNDTITTQDAALILIRALQYKYKGINVSVGSLAGIKDYKDISSYAEEAVGFTVTKGITPLDGEGKLNAKGAVNRATAAQYIYNVFNYKN